MFYKFFGQTEVSQKYLKSFWSYDFNNKTSTNLGKKLNFLTILKTLMEVQFPKRCRKVKTKLFMYCWALHNLQQRKLTSTFNEFWKSRILVFVSSVQLSLIFVLKVCKMTLTTMSIFKWLSKTPLNKTKNMTETYNLHNLLKVMKSWTLLPCFSQLPVKWATSGQNGVHIQEAQSVCSKSSLLRNQTLVFTKTAFRAPKQHRVSISGVQVSLPVEGDKLGFVKTSTQCSLVR